MTNWTFARWEVVMLAASACNNVGTCPSADSVSPGASCTGESLACAYTLQSPSPTCDGTTVEGGIATSCVCTKGTWSCPQPVSCPAVSAGDAAPGDDAAGGDDGGGQEAGGQEAGGQEAGGQEAGGVDAGRG